jgi:S1-C subfamily serine protease
VEESSVFGTLLLATLAPAAPLPAAAAPSPVGTPAIGVRVDNTGSCVVSEVYPHLPAGKAGLKPGDRIVRIGSLEPTHFNQVITHVQTYRPGAVLEVEVDRDGRRQVFHLRLVPRPAEFDSLRNFPTLPGFPDN